MLGLLSLYCNDNERSVCERKTPMTGFQEVFHYPSNHFELWVILHASFVLIVLYTARKLFIKSKLPF